MMFTPDGKLETAARINLSLARAGRKGMNGMQNGMKCRESGMNGRSDKRYRYSYVMTPGK
ncbi:hypothetical protein HA38_20405 [Pantoea allii]|jgi:hypothetical protein|nr:hypothetical protein A6A26_18220 [Pantoea sp. OXWO6B1]ORM82613.1 hypothetical protein HA38_20405 [Pantoea allii]PBJ97761.1 hypothetical protein CMR03_24220 [Pantoea allii]